MLPDNRRVTPASLAAIAALAMGATACGGEVGRDAGPRGLPPGFVNELVARVSLPTDVAFIPRGGMLIATKNGAVHIVRGGRLIDRPALTLDGVCTERERGLTGLAVDPAFVRNRFVYVYYTFAKYGDCPSDVRRGPVNRLVRYVLGRNGRLDRGSATILLDNIPSFHAIHNGGALEFGKDGLLYVGVGDGGHDYAGRTNRSPLNPAARDMHALLGKVLRITRDGVIPADNPYAGPRTTECGSRGVVTPGLICREIFAWGLRNPFRLAMDPNAEDVRFFINDVGQSTWEEIDLGRRGADYGWNLREGPCPREKRVRCAPAPPSMEDPVYAYAQNRGCRSITGGAFVPQGAWTTEYEGSYLFADFICGKIFRLARRDGAWRRSVFAENVSTPVTIRFGPNDGGVALYYTTFDAGGEVRRIVFRGRDSV